MENDENPVETEAQVTKSESTKSAAKAGFEKELKVDPVKEDDIVRNRGKLDMADLAFEPKKSDDPEHDLDPGHDPQDETESDKKKVIEFDKPNEPDVKSPSDDVPPEPERPAEQKKVHLDDKWLNVKIPDDDELLERSRRKELFSMPNAGFIYHNKLPKCGSTTMHAILGVLSHWNGFRYLKLEPSLVKFFDGEKMSTLINTLLVRSVSKCVKKERRL